MTVWGQDKVESRAPTRRWRPKKFDCWGQNYLFKSREAVYGSRAVGDADDKRTGNEPGLAGQQRESTAAGDRTSEAVLRHST